VGRLGRYLHKRVDFRQFIARRLCKTNKKEFSPAGKPSLAQLIAPSYKDLQKGKHTSGLNLTFKRGLSKT